MYRFLIIVLSFALISCGGSGGSSDNGSTAEVRDLSGTWLYRTTKDFYYESPRGLAYTETLDRIMIVDDTENSSIQLYECIDYPSSPIQATDLDGALRVTLPGGGIQDFTEISVDDYEYNDPDRELLSNGFSSLPKEVEKTYRFKKLSDTKDIDVGMFSLNGPVSVNEDAHVCGKFFTSGSNASGITLQAAYGTSSVDLTFQFPLNTLPTIGTYPYTYAPSGQIFFFGISSNDIGFQQGVGGNFVSTLHSVINVVTSDDQVFAGNYTINNFGINVYSGEFYIELPSSIP